MDTRVNSHWRSRRDGLRKQHTFCDATKEVSCEMMSANWTTAEISYWWRVTTEIWVVLLIGRAAREIFLQPIRCTPQTWVVTHHQYGISARVGGVAKCRQFSKATEGITLGSIVADCRFQCFVACYIASCPFMPSEASREGQTPPNGELIRRLNALYSNPEFNSNERQYKNSIWTALKDLHTSIRTVLSHDNFHWLYNLHRHWWGHEGCVCCTMGFSTDMVYYLLVQNSYHVLVIRKELNNLKKFSFSTNARGTLACCDKIGGIRKK